MAKEDLKVSKSDQKRSGGWGVSASPLNAVKLELVLVIIVGIALALVTNAVIDDNGYQMLTLGSYGLLAGGGLILRTRYLTTRYMSSRNAASAEE